MAVVNYQRILDGTTLSGKFGESMQAALRWRIRVNTPTTSQFDILVEMAVNAGLRWGAAHPDMSALKATEFELAPEGKEGMVWVLTVKYSIPPRIPNASGIPGDVWEFNGGTTTVPLFVDKDNVTICNAAGDPLEGLERERHEFGWTLRKTYATEALFTSAADIYPGKVNGAPWAYGPAKTWKCYLRAAKIVSISKLDGDDDGAKLAFIEATWEFKYEPLTWRCMPWDVGFMELVGGSRKTIVGSDGKAVKQPVALNSNGTKKADGQRPSVINAGAGVEIYDTANFTTGFGSPSLLT
jgi:hypothetical protein